MVESTVASDNVIGRLYNIICKLTETEGSNTEGCFAKVFSVEQTDRVAILLNYAELFKMCDRGLKEIEQLAPKHIKKYTNTISNLIEGLSKIYFNAREDVISNGLDLFKKHFDKTLMIEIEYCAYYLSEHNGETIVEDEIIQDIIKEVDELTQEILSSSLNKELEKLIVNQLNNVRESLLKYRLYGSKGILDNVSNTLGTLVLNREKAHDNKEKGIVERVFGIIGRINAIFSLKNNSIELMNELIKKISGE